ncbi:hypothetical protein DFH09DRAFT_1284999 [Mycena vulgaris]|nr:hypothetical protein DFH09DRAFT_1284999 [Mycena vulgaris]
MDDGSHLPSPPTMILVHGGDPPQAGGEPTSIATAQDYARLHTSLAQNIHLHSILALALVFHQAPSALQLARVLDIPWADVIQAVGTLSDILVPPVYYHSAVRVPVRLRRLLVDPGRPTRYIDLRAWHAVLAVWCLERSSLNYDARDILYGADFWASHLCVARPSQALWDALRRSPLPTCLESHGVLPRVIAWLQTVDVEDTRELISVYRNTYRETAAALAGGMRPKILGGLLEIEMEF